jgi:hypothetical protein
VTSFSETEAQKCFSCSEKPPEFRVIALGKYVGKNRELTTDVSVALFCGECLEQELSGFHESLKQVKEFGCRE